MQISISDRKWVDKLIRMASSILGWPHEHVEVVGERRITAKLLSILDDDSQPLQQTLTKVRSSFSERLIHSKYMKEWYVGRFFQAGIRLHKQHYSQQTLQINS